MDEFFELTGNELKQLYEELKFADRGAAGLYKLRVYVEGEHLKFKANEYVWSPPIGKKVQGN